MKAIATFPVRRKNDPCCGATAAPSLSTGQTMKMAERLKAVADPTRLRILDLLVEHTEPLCVCDLTVQFPQNQPTISHHLKLMRDAGLIDTEKRGIWSYYWPTDQGRRLLLAIQTLT